MSEDPPSVHIDRLDHLVLTVANADRTIEWYERVLGMEAVRFGDGRRALTFGQQKLNLHEAGSEIKPFAGRPTPGSADVCLISGVGLGIVQRHLETHAVPIEIGPVERTGAIGPITSLYLRDPDGNLIELSTYHNTEHQR